jgi:DNA-binding NarL/FixJ family response regulator
MKTHLSSPADPGPRRVRVLLVDDSARVRHELRQLLELSGALQIVGEAGDGLEAVRLAGEIAPDVVVMDLEMPVLDGCEATRRIKARRHAPRVVILSVHAGAGEGERLRAAGADGFVVKGASYQILLSAILEKDGSPNSLDIEKGEKS